MNSVNSGRPTWVEIHLDRLVQNFQESRRFIGDDVHYMAVVKADAYGHGAVKCAQALSEAGVDRFGVALPEEGLELRTAGITQPILCLGGFWPGQQDAIVAEDLNAVIYRSDIAALLDRAAADKGVTAKIHIKIDTGMGRIGVRPDELSGFCERLKAFRNLAVEGVMSHFASADDLTENDFTRQQIEVFRDSVSVIRSNGFDPEILDLANSPGAVIHKESKFSMVRLGGILYGLGNDIIPHSIDRPKTEPVLTLHSRITHLKRVLAGETLGYGRTFAPTRDSLIATIPIGYQDGYTRSLSNQGRAIVAGGFVPVVGRISMDWTLLDVTDSENVAVGDEVMFIGSNGDLVIAAEELAALTDTISYEITCGINRRVPRRYL